MLYALTQPYYKCSFAKPRRPGSGLGPGSKGTAWSGPRSTWARVAVGRIEGSESARVGPRRAHCACEIAARIPARQDLATPGVGASV
eukprot:2052766-Rhodomonas_salina.5